MRSFHLMLQTQPRLPTPRPSRRLRTTPQERWRERLRPASSRFSRAALTEAKSQRLLWLEPTRRLSLLCRSPTFLTRLRIQSTSSQYCLSMGTLLEATFKVSSPRSIQITCHPESTFTLRRLIKQRWTRQTGSMMEMATLVYRATLGTLLPELESGQERSPMLALPSTPKM